MVLIYRFQPIFNDNGAIAGSSATRLPLQITVIFLLYCLYTEQFTFDKTFGNHHINAIAVYE